MQTLFCIPLSSLDLVAVLQQLTMISTGNESATPINFLCETLIENGSMSIQSNSDIKGRGVKHTNIKSVYD